jgi:hypothetical protein
VRRRQWPCRIWRSSSITCRPATLSVLSPSPAAGRPKRGSR